MSVQKFPVTATIVCLIAVILLCSLGYWQIQRLEWKNSLQANLDSTFSNKVPAQIAQTDLDEVVSHGTMKRVRVSGQIDLSRSLVMRGRVLNGKGAVAVIAPMALKGADVAIPVEVGCTTNTQFDPRLKAQTKHSDITGILRLPKTNFVTPINNPESHEWWQINTTQLEQFWHESSVSSTVVTLEESGLFYEDGKIAPCLVEKKLRNDHAQYATFWFAMAGVLLVMWGLRFLRPYLQSA